MSFLNTSFQVFIDLSLLLVPSKRNTYHLGVKSKADTAKSRTHDSSILDWVFPMSLESALGILLLLLLSHFQISVSIFKD